MSWMSSGLGPGPASVWLTVAGTAGASGSAVLAQSQVVSGWAALLCAALAIVARPWRSCRRS